MRKKTQITIFLVCLSLLVAAGIVLLPSILHSQGCPPNDQCPSGWEPVAFSCWQLQCEGPGGEGYCVLCRKNQAV